ncbi:MAG: precorrin-3B C(17)-methyltransferase [Crenarchaeota archaeon]|nr:MAG: precorrin-3B C(17)-methyltransferase [Thermoproteota archaeon]RDJ34664.1 MAG: precorrin-3B C(17)-methyltransferase [Thermoproteota archaeon]RDJ34884.1 MAG: precorrin-3B C(17)-methyltransferase [Thermoproteota archaeon]RDJ38584.1 MAG: precorrin-3B C(17)-methyltransferase [Thermoproteota archaeon]
MAGKLFIVGVGPGHHDHMTFRAKQAIEESDTIVGYETYVNLVQDLIDGKEIYRYAMTQEVERAHQCIDLAKSGKIVSLVSSGDPGIYGMAGLIYETLAEQGWDPKSGLSVEIIPGVSALNSCASIIGSPLMTDFAVVSMSDLLVPWEIIVKRVEAAAQGDFVIVIYNPSSKKRIHQLQDTRKILLKHRKPSTPVAIIKGAFRETQSIVLTDLDKMENYADKLGMISTVIVGNSSTYNYKDLMINPRGYKSKYNLKEQTNPELKV